MGSQAKQLAEIKAAFIKQRRDAVEAYEQLMQIRDIVMQSADTPISDAIIAIIDGKSEPEKRQGGEVWGRV